MCGRSSTRYLCVLFSVLRVLVQFQVDLFACCVWDVNRLWLYLVPGQSCPLKEARGGQWHKAVLF